MVIATIRMVLPPQKRLEALRILRSSAEGSRVFPGCLSSRIYEDLQEENVVMFEEMWQSEEDLDQHLRSDEYRNLLLIMEMAVQHPEVRFAWVSGYTGIETIEKARASGDRLNRH